MTRPAPAAGTEIVNAMTVDVEDYFHVSAFDGLLPRHRWDELETRVDTLVNAVKSATESWKTGQAAEKKNDFKAAIDAYEEAIIVYPSFKGLEQRIEELRARQ